MYIDMMQQVLSSSSKVLVDQKGGGNNLLYLPLDKLIQSTAAGAPPMNDLQTAAGKSANNAEQVAPQTVVSDPATTRDTLRSRDREGR
jgi:membrane protease subunit HflK